MQDGHWFKHLVCASVQGVQGENKRTSLRCGQLEAALASKLRPQDASSLQNNEARPEGHVVEDLQQKLDEQLEQNALLLSHLAAAHQEVLDCAPGSLPLYWRAAHICNITRC